MTTDMSDPMSMLLQYAARSDNRKLFPLTIKTSEDTDKVIGQLVRRGWLKREWVKASEPKWKKIKGFGNANLKITSEGLKAIGWK